MKRYLLSFVFLLGAWSAFAQNTQLALSYTGGSHLTQIKAEAQQALSLNTKVGLKVKFADEKNFKKPVYALYVPVTIGGDFLRLSVTPF
jgi:hypothetical protein